MSNLSKRARDKARSRLRVLAALLAVGVVVFLGFSFGHTFGLHEGKQQMQQEMQGAVEQAKADTQAKFDDLSKKLKDAQDQLAKLTPPPGPDPKVPPPHDALFYANQLKDKVEAAKSPEDKENSFWASVCTTQRELVGVPIAVWDGARYDTYIEFNRNVGPYYTKLVVNKDVSFYTDSMLELADHVQQEMAKTSCP